MRRVKEHCSTLRQCGWRALLAAFTIQSDVGTFEARGPGMLALRVYEIGALLALDALAQSEVAKEGE